MRNDDNKCLYVREEYSHLRLLIRKITFIQIVNSIDQSNHSICGIYYFSENRGIHKDSELNQQNLINFLRFPRQQTDNQTIKASINQYNQVNSSLSFHKG